MYKEARILANYARKSLATLLRPATWMPGDANIPVNEMAPFKGVVYETTDACNSRCLSCNIWAAPTTKDPLTVEQLERILRDPLFDSLEDFIITGGEPSLRKDIPEMIRVIHRTRPHAKISLSTNGLLPERTLETVRMVVAERIPLTVGISLDGIGEEHDRVRGVPGNFAKVDQIITEIHALGLKNSGLLRITVGLTISPMSVLHVKAVEAYCKEKGVNFFPQLYEEFSYYSNTTETLRELKKGGHIEGAVGHHLSEDSHDGLKAYPINPLKLIDNLPPSPQNEILLKAMSTNRPIMRSRGATRNFCASLSNFMLLRANGDVTPCLRWSERRLGNLRDHAPSEVWRSQAVRAMRAEVRSCSGCSNTWATAWSAEYWFPQFIDIFWRAFLKKKFTRRDIAISVSAPIVAPIASREPAAR